MWWLAFFDFSDDAFRQGFWEGFFQLVALGIVAGWVNIVYQRYRRRADARQELIDEIDEFTVAMYKPRKIYQTVFDRESCKLFDCLPSDADREAERVRVIRQSLEGVVEAIGRFRAVQIKMVPLYGHHLELFAHYLAIWRYLKEIRQRIESLETLYFHHETAGDVDAFYRLIDMFRYRILVERFAWKPPHLVRPPQDLLAELRKKGDEVYQHYFGGNGTAKAAPAPPAPAPTEPKPEPKPEPAAAAKALDGETNFAPPPAPPPPVANGDEAGGPPRGSHG